MSVVEQFFDTNVLLYLLSGDDAKADRAEDVLSQGGHISVQVLIEFASIATRKLIMSHADVREVLSSVRAACTVNPLTEEIHDLGLQLAERYLQSATEGAIWLARPVVVHSRLKGSPAGALKISRPAASPARQKR